MIELGREHNHIMLAVQTREGAAVNVDAHCDGVLPGLWVDSQVSCKETVRKIVLDLRARIAVATKRHFDVEIVEN